MKRTLTNTHQAKYHKQKADVALYDRLEDDGFYYQLQAPFDPAWEKKKLKKLDF